MANPAQALPREDLILGRYRPLRPLGSGGSGSVWLVRDEEAGRDVALKIVARAGKAGSRAEREVEAATRLRHSRCLRALAFHRDEGHVYVAYEYVRGRNLRDALRNGHVDDSTAIEAAAQVLEALAHAHGRKIAHRDVKPANVMLEEGDEVSTRLLDFGMARLDELDGLTATGDVPGTLAYIAPERLDGYESAGAADVWAVGVILWEALAGWHPFQAPSPVETQKRIGAGATPLAQERPDLPQGLCATVDRMLAVDPRRRPSAHRAALAIRDAADERARRPRPLSSRRTLRARALNAGLAALVTAGVIALLPFFPHGWPFLLGGIAALVALRSPSTGLAVALLAPILPLGNLSLGLALAYVPLAVAWFVLFRREVHASLLFALGGLLAPIGAVTLMPLASLGSRSPFRRSLVGAAGVLAGAAVCALLGRGLPLTGEEPGSTSSLAGAGGPVDATAGIFGALAAHPAVLVGAVVVGAASGTAAYAADRGLWGLAVWGSAYLGGIVLLPAAAGAADVHALFLALGVWAASLALVALRARQPAQPETASGTMAGP
ncbi:MAG TPA: serine/threonine-protein kinase [Gaiellaceae bacterium]